MAGSRQERELVKALDEKALWESLSPAIHAILKHGTGSAQLLLKKSESLAAVTLLTSLASKKDDVRLRAAIELLNRSLGKPVERRIDVYADIGQLNETELDTQIKTLMKQVGESGALDVVMNSVPKVAKDRYRTARQRKLKSTAEIVYDEGEVVVGAKGSGGIEGSEGGVSEVAKAEASDTAGE